MTAAPNSNDDKIRLDVTNQDDPKSTSQSVKATAAKAIATTVKKTKDISKKEDKVEEEKKQEEQVFSCPCCDKEAKLICTRCHQQRYCSRECQKKHWKAGHKQQCSKLINSGSVVDNTTSSGRTVLVNLKDQNTAPTPPKQSSESKTLNLKTFVLKIQVPLDTTGSTSIAPFVKHDDNDTPMKRTTTTTTSTPMMAYDKDRTHYFLISSMNCKKVQLLERTIRTEGIARGAKAYFHARIRQDQKMVIYLDQQETTNQNIDW